jgi:hypothetical protein
MLDEIIETEQRVKAGYDDLDHIRKMIRSTSQNIDSHMDTVDTLK